MEFQPINFEKIATETKPSLWGRGVTVSKALVEGGYIGIGRDRSLLTIIVLAMAGTAVASVSAVAGAIVGVFGALSMAVTAYDLYKERQQVLKNETKLEDARKAFSASLMELLKELNALGQKKSLYEKREIAEGIPKETYQALSEGVDKEIAEITEIIYSHLRIIEGKNSVQRLFSVMKKEGETKKEEDWEKDLAPDVKGGLDIFLNEVKKIKSTPEGQKKLSSTLNVVEADLNQKFGERKEERKKYRPHKFLNYLKEVTAGLGGVFTGVGAVLGVSALVLGAGALTVIGGPVLWVTLGVAATFGVAGFLYTRYVSRRQEKLNRMLTESRAEVNDVKNSMEEDREILKMKSHLKVLSEEINQSENEIVKKMKDKSFIKKFLGEGKLFEMQVGLGEIRTTLEKFKMNKLSKGIIKKDKLQSNIEMLEKELNENINRLNGIHRTLSSTYVHDDSAHMSALIEARYKEVSRSQKVEGMEPVLKLSLADVKDVAGKPSERVIDFQRIEGAEQSTLGTTSTGLKGATEAGLMGFWRTRGLLTVVAMTVVGAVTATVDAAAAAAVGVLGLLSMVGVGYDLYRERKNLELNKDKFDQQRQMLREQMTRLLGDLGELLTLKRNDGIDLSDYNRLSQQYAANLSAHLRTIEGENIEEKILSVYGVEDLPSLLKTVSPDESEKVEKGLTALTDAFSQHGVYKNIQEKTDVVQKSLNGKFQKRKQEKAELEEHGFFKGLKYTLAGVGGGFVGVGLIAGIGAAVFGVAALATVGWPIIVGGVAAGLLLAGAAVLYTKYVTRQQTENNKALAENTAQLTDIKNSLSEENNKLALEKHYKKHMHEIREMKSGIEKLQKDLKESPESPKQQSEVINLEVIRKQLIEKQSQLGELKGHLNVLEKTIDPSVKEEVTINTIDTLQEELKVALESTEKRLSEARISVSVKAEIHEVPKAFELPKAPEEKVEEVGKEIKKKEPHTK